MAEQMMQDRANEKVAKKAIPAGYKQTEVGVIPEDWAVISIQNTLEKKYILDQMDGNHGELYPKSHEFSSFGVPYIGATDFSNGDVDFKNCKFLPLERARKFKKGIAKNGDVLFAHNATVGPVSILDSDFDFVVLSTTATYYRCDNKVLSNRYLAQYFCSNFFVEQYKAVMSQSTRNQVPILAQRKFVIILPPSREQVAIATVLSDTDALIASLEQLITKKQAIKTATMQQLLTGRTRLPQFALRPDGTPKGYKSSELGQIPEDWESVYFGNIAKPSASRINPKMIGGGDICIELEHISSGTGTLLGETTTNCTSSLKSIFEPGDVLFGKLRAYLKKYILADFHGVCSTEIWVLKPDVNLATSEYIYSVVQSQRFINAASEAYGTHMPRADWSVVKYFPVMLPSTVEQTAIATILSDMDSELTALEQKLAKARDVKLGMMQQLLTGRIRLPLPQEA